MAVPLGNTIDHTQAIEYKQCVEGTATLACSIIARYSERGRGCAGPEAAVAALRTIGPVDWGWGILSESHAEEGMPNSVCKG
jgi:hypothetical protein